MSRLTDSAPPVQLGQVNARNATGVVKHNSPLPTAARPPAAPIVQTAQSIPLEKVAAGQDPLANVGPSSADPPIAVRSVQKVWSPAPVPGNVSRVRSPNAVTPIRPSIPESNNNSNNNNPRQQSQALATAATAIDEMTKTFLNRIKTPAMDCSRLPNNVETLEKLARSSCWTIVVTMSQILLNERSVPSNALKNVSGYFGEGSRGGPLHVAAKLRFEALFRTKSFDELMNEADEVLIVEHERIAREQPGSITDTAILMRLLRAEVLAMTGRGEEAVEHLARLLDDLRLTGENITGSSQQLPAWAWRVRWAMVNTSLRGRYTAEAIKQLLGMLQDLCDLETTPPEVHVEEAKIVVLSRLSRTLLQVGALQAAIGYCDMAVAQLGTMNTHFSADASSASALAQANMQVNMTRALALFGINEYAEAMSLFEAIITSEEGCTDTRGEFASGGFRSVYESLLCTEESLFSAAVNNYAVCALHLKQVDKSVSKLEDLIARNPTRHIIDPVIFNLCTLYDLSCTPELSKNKKKVLQRIASYANLHEPLLNFKSFRLS